MPKNTKSLLTGNLHSNEGESRERTENKHWDNFSWDNITKKIKWHTVRENDRRMQGLMTLTKLPEKASL